MRLHHLLLATSLLVSTAYATPVLDTNPFDFTTTIIGGGNTLIFPNVGGPSNYTYYTRVNQISAVPLYVYVNGGPITQGSLLFTLSSSPNYQDVSFSVPAGAGQPSVGAVLYGPNLVSFVDGTGFYVFPGTYNLTDSSGTSYTYTVTTLPNAPPASVPEIDPSLATAGLALLTGGFAVLRGRRHVGQTA